MPSSWRSSATAATAIFPPAYSERRLGGVLHFLDLRRERCKGGRRRQDEYAFAKENVYHSPSPQPSPWEGEGGRVVPCGGWLIPSPSQGRAKRGGGEAVRMRGIKRS